MPIKSQAQKRFLETHHPKIAKKWAAETLEVARLPEHVKKRKILKT